MQDRWFGAGEATLWCYTTLLLRDGTSTSRKHYRSTAVPFTVWGKMLTGSVVLGNWCDLRSAYGTVVQAIVERGKYRRATFAVSTQLQSMLASVIFLREESWRRYVLQAHLSDLKSYACFSTFSLRQDNCKHALLPFHSGIQTC
jgi:hypothetical protein